MKTVNIRLNSTNSINAFLNAVSRFDDSLFIKTDGYTVNARSPIGIFSCDLSRPVTLLINSNEEKILSALRKFY